MCVCGSQPCSTLLCPMDCNLTGSSIDGIFQARTLEWVAISYSRASSQPRDPTLQCLLHCRQILYHGATREAQGTAKTFLEGKIVNQDGAAPGTVRGRCLEGRAGQRGHSKEKWPLVWRLGGLNGP